MMKFFLYMFILIALFTIIFIIFNRTLSIDNVLKNFPQKFTFYQYNKGKVLEKKIVFKVDKEYKELINILKL